MKEIIKYIFIFVIFISATLAGCNCNKTENNSENIIKDNNQLTIKTDELLKKDIQNYLEELNKESIFPIEVLSENKDSDLIITLNPESITEDWNKQELYKFSKELNPNSFSEKFADKIDDFVIYIGTPNGDKNAEIVINYLKKAFKDNPPIITTLTFTGDIMLSRWVAMRMKQYGFDYPFKKTQDYLKQASLTIGNLESPSSETGPYQTKARTMTFRYDPQVTPVLKEVGFDVFSLANNHFGNAGQKGIEFTMNNLTENDLSYLGAGKNSEASHKPLIKEIDDIKFAFLGYSDSSVTPHSYASTKNTAGLNLDNVVQMKEDVKSAKNNADYIIVSMHMGTEYQNKPNQKQIDFAKSAIEAGADFIYGHHPHVIQSIEFIDNKPVFYSLGNFIFDQNQKNTQQGLVVNAKLIYNKLVGLELKSVNIKNYAQPNWEDESKIDIILDRIK